MTTYRGRTVAFFAALALGLLLIVTHVLPMLLPDGIATQIGHNSESLLFAIAICGIVQFLLPWLRHSNLSPWLVTAPGAVGCFVLGYVLIHSGWPSTIVTLNEPVIAVGFMLLYLSIPRPFRYAPLVAIGIFVGIVIFFRTHFVLDQAESLVPALLAPLAIDVFDRTIMEPGREGASGRRLAWMSLLLALAVSLIFAARWARTDLHGPVRLGIDYAQRAAEAYWGWLLIHAYFGYWIGRARGWSPRIAVDRRRDAEMTSSTDRVV
jgi:hypothetical protein